MEKWPLKSSPYAVQIEALKKANQRKKFAYFAEMGCGKSAMILAEFTNLVEQDLVDSLLIVCPNSLKSVWADEMEKMGFQYGRLSQIVWPEIIQAPSEHYVIAIMNYEATITMKGTAFILNIVAHHRTMLVIDESIQIKNPKARRTKVLINAAKNAAFVRLLSGQPVVQGPHDLWSQFRCLGECDGMNYYVFRNVFCKMGGFMNKQVMGAKDPEALNTWLNRVSFRARKEDWLDLPKQIYTQRHIEMTTEQKKHYEEMRKHLVTMISEQEIDAQMIMTQMLKLQQISSGFIIDGEHRVHHIPGGKVKVQAVEEVMEEATGKVLIFTYFRASTEGLGSALLYYRPAVIQGGMSPVDMRAQQVKFEQDSKCRVLICQIQSGKYGFTFLGGPGHERCSTTIFYENSFSLDSRIQAEARNHRIGQDQPVVYVDLITSPIDKVVVNALAKKQDVASAIIDNLGGRNG